jgi:two-component sensor histidine kinase
LISARLAGPSTVLTLADDGPGLPDSAPAGLGLRLIDGLARQIEGTLAWERGNGARLVLAFPIADLPERGASSR